MSGRDDEIMLKQTKSELRDNNVKFWNLPVNDNGECETSALTEDSDPLVLEMDQLEAELEFDQLQKLPGHPVDTNFHEEIRPKLDEVNFMSIFSFVCTRKFSSFFLQLSHFFYTILAFSF